MPKCYKIVFDLLKNLRHIVIKKSIMCSQRSAIQL